MHPEARAFIEREVAARGPFLRVLEFGARNINGGVRDLFTECYVGTDITPGPGVDVVCDAAEWTEGGFDAVVCCEVLEHTPNGGEIIKAARRALTWGGTLLLTCATDPRAPHSAHDGGGLRNGEFYANVSRAQLVLWLTEAGFRDYWTEIHPQGDLYCTATA